LSVNRGKRDDGVVNRRKSDGGVFGGITMKFVCRVGQPNDNYQVKSG